MKEGMNKKMVEEKEKYGIENMDKEVYKEVVIEENVIGEGMKK